MLRIKFFRFPYKEKGYKGNSLDYEKVQQDIEAWLDREQVTRIESHSQVHEFDAATFSIFYHDNDGHGKRPR